MLGIDGRTFAKIVIPYGTLISGGREVFIYTISQVETVAKQLKEHNHAR